MKKIKPILLSMLMLFTLLAAPYRAEAAVSGDTADNSTITYFDAGSYMITTIGDEPGSKKPSGIQPFAASTTVSKSKTARFYNSENQVMWYVKVTGSFTYTGSSAKCNSASVTADSLSNSWKVSKLSAAHSGATAYASATGKQYFLGTVIDTISRTVSLTCSPTGIFS